MVWQILFMLNLINTPTLNAYGIRCTSLISPNYEKKFVDTLDKAAKFCNVYADKFGIPRSEFDKYCHTLKWKNEPLPHHKSNRLAGWYYRVVFDYTVKVLYTRSRGEMADKIHQWIWENTFQGEEVQIRLYFFENCKEYGNEKK